MIHEVISFNSLEDMKKRLLKPLNKCFGKRDTIGLEQKELYFELFCKYEGCSFCVRYQFEEVESGNQTCDEQSETSVFNFNNYILKEQIKYKIKHCRTLNHNHSTAAHKSAIVKPRHSIIDY